MLTPSLLK